MSTQLLSVHISDWRKRLFCLEVGELAPWELHREEKWERNFVESIFDDILRRVLLRCGSLAIARYSPSWAYVCVCMHMFSFGECLL